MNLFIENHVPIVFVLLHSQQELLADYLSVYEEAGLVGPRSTFAHGIHLDNGMRKRLAEPKGHFVGPEMLTPQLAIWEPPHYGVHYDVMLQPTDIVADIAATPE